MKSQFRAVNRFISKIKSTSSIDWISNSGTFQIQDIAIGWFSLPQWAFTYFVTADFAQTGKEEIFRIVNTAWDVLTYDKRIPVWGYVKPAHTAGASIRVNDVADILNEMSDNIDNFGDINRIDGTQTVKVWGGVFNNGGTVYNVSSQTLIVTVGQLIDNTTNYIHFDIATRLFIVTASSTLAAAVCMASVVVAGWIIGTITDLRPGFSMTYGEISTKLDKSGGLRDTMQVANTTTDWLFVGWKTKIPLVNADFATGSWTRSSAGWIGDSTYGWYVNSGVGTYSAAYDTGRMKLQTSAVGSYLEVWVSAGYYPIDQYAIAVEPNTAYTVEYDMETLLTSGTSNDGAWIQVCTYDSGWASVVEIPGTKVKVTTGNTHYTINFTTWPVTAYINPQMRIYGHTGTATLQMSAWFDNITITRASKEILKPISISTSMTDSDEFLFEKQDGSFSKAKLGDVKWNIVALNNSVEIAGESLAANDCITIERLNDYFIGTDNIDLQTMGNVVANNRISQKVMGNWVGFTTINFMAMKTWSPTDNVTITIETDNAWVPSGTAVTNGTITFVGSWFSTGWVDQTFTFPGTVNLTNGTVYHIVIRRQNAADPSNYYNFAIRNTRTRFTTNNTYNASWWTPNFSYVMMIKCTWFHMRIAVKSIWLYQALSQAEWFVQTWYSIWQSIIVYRWIVNLTWLVPWAIYMVSDTAWVISTSGWTFKTRIWEALSTTNLLVSPAYPNNIQVNPDIKIWALPNGLASHRRKFLMKDSGTLIASYGNDGSSTVFIRVTKNWVLGINVAAWGNTSATHTMTFAAWDTIIYTSRFEWAGNCNVTLSRTSPLINMLDIT